MRGRETESREGGGGGAVMEVVVRREFGSKVLGRGGGGGVGKEGGARVGRGKGTPQGRGDPLTVVPVTVSSLPLTPSVTLSPSATSSAI